MADSANAQVIRLPNLLRAKIGAKPGPSLDDIVAEAESALGELKNQYEVWIRDYLRSINEALAEAQASARPDPAVMKQIKLQAHEINGQGATFGYPLLTTVGHMLHGLIDRKGAAAAQHLDLIAAHIGFMNLVVNNEIRDEGGLRENQVLSGLEAAAKKALKS